MSIKLGWLFGPYRAHFVFPHPVQFTMLSAVPQALEPIAMLYGDR